MESSYYKIHDLGDRIFHIEEPAGAFTSLIIGDAKALLIDTGYGFSDLHKFVQTLTDLPLIVVNTHGHLDHCGGNYQFNKVYINYLDMPVYYWYQSVEKLTILDKFKRDYGSGIQEIWPESFDEEAYKQATAIGMEPLCDHQIFDLGGRKVETIYLPGHTKGSVVFLDDRSRILFSGDNISKTIWLQFDHSASLEEYVRGLNALRNYPIKGIVSSHLPDVFPKHIIDWIMLTVSHIKPEESKLFVHPRTGNTALQFWYPVTGMDQVSYIHVVYPGTLSSETVESTVDECSCKVEYNPV